MKRLIAVAMIGATCMSPVLAADFDIQWPHIKRGVDQATTNDLRLTALETAGVNTNVTATNAVKWAGQAYSGTPSVGDLLRYDGTNWGPGGFVYLGNKSSADIPASAMTEDGNWHDVSLASFGVPSSASYVVVQGAVTSAAVPAYVRMRSNGATGGYNAYTCLNSVAGVANFTIGIVPLNGTNLVQYLVTAGVSDDWFTIIGYGY